MRGMPKRTGCDFDFFSVDLAGPHAAAAVLTMTWPDAVQTYYGYIIVVARRAITNFVCGVEVDDLVQQVCISFLKRTDLPPQEESQIKKVLVVATRNHLISLFRDKKRRITTCPLFYPDGSSRDWGRDNPDLEKVDACDTLAAALSHCTTKQAEAIRAYCDTGTWLAAAKKLGVSRQAMSARAANAFRRIRAAMPHLIGK